jgi:hypothetical protein
VQITSLKQRRGGSGIALDVSILHRIFAYAISKGMMPSQSNQPCAVPKLHDLLQEAYAARKPRSGDAVLINPQTKLPFTSSSRLWHRMVSLVERSGVGRVHLHCFRDTFICDMLARGTSTYIVGQMVADETDTIEKNYAKFVPAARDEAQDRMANGLGIEERAKIATQRGRKVVGFPG